MPRAKGILATAFFVGILAWAPPAPALETYSPAQTQQFMDWCTGAKSATESTCSCTLKSLAQTLPATALATFLSKELGDGGFNLSTAAISAGAMVANAMAGCAK